MKNEGEKIMNEEIKKRLESTEWDNHIARTVLERKRGAQKKILYPALLGGLAAAAAVTVIFLFGIRNPEDQGNYNYMQFISWQVGTAYNSTFGINGSMKESPYGEDLLASDDIDDMIEETMAVR